MSGYVCYFSICFSSFDLSSMLIIESVYIFLLNGVLRKPCFHIVRTLAVCRLFSTNSHQYCWYLERRKLVNRACFKIVWRQVL